MRLEAGLSLGQLSQHVHYSKAQLSKVERGLKTPSAELARLCDARLRAGGELLSLLPEQPPAKLPAADEERGKEEVWLMHLSADGPSWFQPMGRRQVMAAGAAGAAAAVGLGTSAAAAGPATETGGATLLETARSLFDQYRRLGQTSSPEVVLPALIAQTHSLRELSARTGPRSRDALLRLASRYAEYVGWLVQETGNDAAALWWTDRAVGLAAEGGDTDLAAYALVRRGLITLYRQDGRQTVSLAQQAQGSALPPRIRGLAWQREAQGHALAGDYDACMRCLDRARELLRHEEPQAAAPVLGTTTLADPVSTVTGWCMHDLGRPHKAARILEEQISRIPPHALRARTRYGVRHALAQAMAGEIDHACDLARELLGAASAVQSATIHSDLTRLCRILARHPNSPAVRAISPAINTTLYAGDWRTSL
ncbi:helix-turn-helix domain-containing protein [Streptomyces sp. M600PL45_2]|uniref:Helix-turn-helix domain-containing protein n=2 Tax=Streptomyces marispadix TaxID=2922868 RepID=A0ABS9SS98_9ACTN|nr:helix-turn-helix domain-containing protein [Streptomyces marispadix]